MSSDLKQPYCELRHSEENDIHLVIDGNTIITLLLIDDVMERHERNEQLLNLSNQVYEINKIFEDMGNIVMEQQEPIDNIEENICETKENVIDVTESLIEIVKKSPVNKINKKIMIAGLVTAIIASPIVGTIIGINAGVAILLGSGALTMTCDKLYDKFHEKIHKRFVESLDKIKMINFKNKQNNKS
jgi:hypothetical protein